MDRALPVTFNHTVYKTNRQCTTQTQCTTEQETCTQRQTSQNNEIQQTSSSSLTVVACRTSELARQVTGPTPGRFTRK